MLTWILALSTRIKVIGAAALALLLGVAYAVFLFRSSYRANQSAELSQRRKAAEIAARIKRSRDRLTEYQAKQRAKIDDELRDGKRDHFDGTW